MQLILSLNILAFILGLIVFFCIEVVRKMKANLNKHEPFLFEDFLMSQWEREMHPEKIGEVFTIPNNDYSQNKFYFSKN